MASTCDDTFGVIGWHRAGLTMRRGRSHCLLDVDQTMAFLFASINRDQDGKAKTAKGATTFAPIGCIQDTNLRIVITET